MKKFFNTAYEIFVIPKVKITWPEWFLLRTFMVVAVVLFVVKGMKHFGLI